ncbi:MAG: cupin domain-containing protein [Lautropia sp.]
MALPHASLLDVIDLNLSPDATATAPSTSLLRTGRLQLLHLILPAHHDQAEHHVADECTIHCLSGDVAVVMASGDRRLGPGQLVALPAGQPFGLRARTRSAVLVTLLLHDGNAAVAR